MRTFTTADPAGLSRGRRLLILGICCMSLLIVGLDATIVNIALPSLRADLHTGVTGLQWTVDAYTLVLASLLMLSGSTADRIGRRRTFLLGLIVFTAGSLLCSVAPGLGWLIAFRTVQAVGGSMLNPVAMSIISNVFTDPRERARAIGVWAGVIGLSMALGPVVGGAIIGPVGWRGVFWINVPVGLAALLLTTLFVPESKAAHPRRIDPVGQILVITMLGTLTYGIIQGPEAGWTSPVILTVFTVSAASLALLVAYEPRRAEPLIELGFFRSAPFSGATVIAVCAFSALGGFLLLNTLYLQELRGMPPLHAGLMMLPMAGMTVVAGPLSGRLVAARGPRASLLLGGAGLTAAGVMLAWLSADTSTGRLAVSYLTFGLGFAMVNPPITNTAVSGMPLAQAGVAAATASTSRQIGSSLGVAITGAILTSGLHTAPGGGFTAAARPAWWFVTGAGCAVFILGIVTTSRWARRTAAATAIRLPAETAALPPAGAIPAP